MDELEKQIHDGNWQAGEIPNDLYFSTAQKLSKAITEGVGDSFSYDDPSNSLAAELRANLYQFSGAKSLTHANALRDLLVDENGKEKSFNQFKQDVQSTNKFYNEQALSAEYSNALAQGQMAVKWQDFEALGKDAWLEYRTAGDDRVRASHAALDGIIQKIDSPFWNRAYPPNDWGCRCTVIPADQPADAMTEKEAGSIGKKSVGNPLFENNVGKSKIIYKDDHPYFDSLNGIKELDAVKNYGMKSMGSIMSKADDLPPAAFTKTETDFHIWWDKMIKENGVNETDFVLKDKTGTNVVFDNYFKDHILVKQSEKRYEYAANVADVFLKPDEMWFKTVKNVKEWQYIKYYNDGPHLLTVIEDDGMIKAKTFYKIDKGGYADGQIRKKRTGVLLYKK